MTELTGLKRKAILLFASEKKLGASHVVASYSNKSYADMKRKILSEEEIEWVENSEKPRLKDLSAHLKKVKVEFINKPEICFYHATLIILLRRGYKNKETYKNFENLWETESDFLLNNLSLRWIVSACDTFIDHSPNPLRSSILMNVVTLVNTLKVYETDIFLKTDTDNRLLNKNNVAALYEKHLALYDGLTYFRIGTDDTLKHMRERYQSFNDKDELATSILLYVFDGIHKNSSAFSTLKELHKDEKSQWW